MTSLFETLPVFGKGPTWEDLAPGRVGRTLRRTVTEADLVNFIGVTGMTEAIFIDADYPGKAIPGRLVPAALTQCLIEGLLFQSVIQGVGLALLECHLKALAPVRVGDSIWATLDILEIKPTSKNNRAVVTSEVTVYNQREEAVLSYTVKRMVAGKS
jgi:3-hydroxybutyryl-CoA dehydratase